MAKSGDNNAVTMSNLLAMRIHQVMDESGLQSAPVPVAKDNKSKKVSRGVSAVAMASAIAAQSPAKLAGQKRKESSAAAEKTPVAARKRGARSAPRTGGDAADDDEVEEAEAEAVAEKGDAAEAPKKPAPAKKAAAKKAQTPQRRAADARTKASEASGGPRKRIRWSEEEEHNLSAGVRRFGVGAWSSILDQFYFEARTTIDLKDKWRNMQKSQQKQELRAKAVAARAAMEEKGDKDDDANDDDASADNAAPKE